MSKTFLYGPWGTTGFSCELLADSQWNKCLNEINSFEHLDRVPILALTQSVQPTRGMGSETAPPQRADGDCRPLHPAARAFQCLPAGSAAPESPAVRPSRLKEAVANAPRKKEVKFVHEKPSEAN